MVKANLQTKKRWVLGTTESVWEKRRRELVELKKKGRQVNMCCVEREQGSSGVEKKQKCVQKRGRELGELKRKEVSVWKVNFFWMPKATCELKKKEGDKRGECFEKCIFLECRRQPGNLKKKVSEDNWKCDWEVYFFFLLPKATRELKKKGSVGDNWKCLKRGRWL